ncbi:TIR domain-containing protein [Thioflavicoccus mobilis 8321]|uniref:TIR domain-containing protein n=1 Tax=Thioflavicoccus mobilis 8321 TaxID=765912 RepID=L0GSW1_9GAMM|nr:toll/interleukin-1 receptor domain-containing protein [Thioflavicoccus mobilis]AGA89076.1 TIR domain-containing protein [Thioflavicoccus mobilis 8321]
MLDDETRDVFVSYARKDKKIVSAYLQQLEEHGISYWIDEKDIAVGDSITFSIPRAMKNCRVVLPFVTKNFMARKWPLRELELAIHEHIEDDAVLTPVVFQGVDLTAAELSWIRTRKFFDRSPPNEVAKEVVRLCGRRFGMSLTHHFPASYVGPVWMAIIPKGSAVGSNHKIRLKWGPWKNTVLFSPGSCSAHYFCFSKGYDGMSFPLFVESSQEAIYSFGTGQPSSCHLDINRGWLFSISELLGNKDIKKMVWMFLRGVKN